MLEEKIDQPNTILKALLQQQELAVQLYIQEDNLNWNKVHHCIYSNSLLFGILVFLFQDSLTKGFQEEHVQIACILAIFGLLSCGLFWITLKSGADYIQKRKQTLLNIEKEIGLKKELRIITDIGGIGKAEKSNTVKYLTAIPIIIILLWLVTISAISLIHFLS